MAHYHCYTLRPDRSVSSHHPIEAAGDAEPWAPIPRIESSGLNSGNRRNPAVFLPLP